MQYFNFPNPADNLTHKGAVNLTKWLCVGLTTLLDWLWWCRIELKILNQLSCWEDFALYIWLKDYESSFETSKHITSFCHYSSCKSPPLPPQEVVYVWCLQRGHLHFSDKWILGCKVTQVQKKTLWWGNPFQEIDK